MTDDKDTSKQDFPTWPDPDAENEAETETVVEEIEHDPIAKLTAERDEYLDQLQRSRAEFINFKRRNEQERMALRQFVSKDVISQFLPVIDDLERALASIPETERESSWVTGVSMIQTKLNGTMERLGVSRVEALGKPFDPSMHEAVATEPGTSGAGVVEVYQPGYKIGDFLVRPAMVKTGDLPEAETSDKTSEEASVFNA